MRSVTALLAASLLLSSLPAQAAQTATPPDKSVADKPVTDQTVSAGDVVSTPISDLNLKKDQIPPILLAAQAKPYDLTALRKCGQLAGAIAELDAVLGDDIDLPADHRQKVSAGRVAQAAVGSFIPFRGLIREISGANEQDRRMLLAVQAGMARRAFLKGYGQARGCARPARAAPSVTSAARTGKRPRQQVQFTARPVVQKVD